MLIVNCGLASFLQCISAREGQVSERGGLAREGVGVAARKGGAGKDS